MSNLIRRAVTSDVDRLIRLTRETIGASYRSFLGDDAVDGYIGSGAVERYVEESIARSSVILRDGEIVGYAVWRDDLIDLMMIDHAAQRQGLGTVLLRHVEAELFQSHDELRLESFEANLGANAFYRENGWREARTYFDEDSQVDKTVFVKSVSRLP
jgi:GNAT superfamily N-acetyltransferase